LLAQLRPDGGALPGMCPNVTHKGQLVAPVADRAGAAPHSPDTARCGEAGIAENSRACLLGDAHEASGLALERGEVKPRDFNPWAFRQWRKARENVPMGRTHTKVNEFHAVESKGVSHGAAGSGAL